MKTQEYLRCALLALGAAQAALAQTTDEVATARTRSAIAEFRETASLAGDARRGATLFETCAACHGVTGLGADDGSVPAIAGQHASVLVKQLVDFRHDRRWDERMKNFSSEDHLRGAQELADVAAYVSGLPRWPPLAGGIGDGSALQQGASVYFRECEVCHGPLGQGELSRLRPRLAGQRYLYLLRQLEDTAAGRRPGMDLMHVERVRALTPAQRQGVADYLARLSPDLSSMRRGVR
jgi:cytochrome c553